MKRSDMVCTQCIKFDGSLCRCYPKPVTVENPAKNWCAQGLWHQWSDQYEEMEPFYWGDWPSDN